MANQVLVSLESYEKDFMDFQKKIQNIRKSNPDQFIAFGQGKILASGESIERVRNELEKLNIDPQKTVIEFVSKNEIKMIV